MKTLILGILFFGSLLAQEVVELKLPNTNKVTIKLMFKNGSVCDPTGKEGLTYLTSALITQGGTGELTYADIQNKIYPWATEYYSSVDKEVSIFTFEVHQDFLNEFYPILKGLLLNPSFSQNDFDRVKRNQQNYVDQVIRASSDEEYSKKALEDFLFRGTKYQHMVQGKSESVKAITLDDVNNQYKNFFTRNNLMIGIAGNYSNEFLSTLKKDMQSLSDVKPIIPIQITPQMPKGINVEIIQKDNAFGSAIFAGFPMSLTRKDDDFAALMVANSFLGEHRKSYGKLYQKLRETRSMNYGDYSYIEWYDNGGRNMLQPSGTPRNTNYFSFWIRPVQIAKQLKNQYKELEDIQIGHAHYAIRMAIREIDNLVKNGMTQKDFEATRTFLRSYINLYVQTPSSRLGYLMDSKFYGKKDYVNEMDKKLAKLSLADVNKAIKKYWQVENMCVTIVTDKSEAEPLAKSLKENLTSPMSYSNIVKAGLPKEVLAEDVVVANYKLNINEVKIINSADTFK